MTVVVVLSPGRTGSQLIAHNISKYFSAPIESWNGTVAAATGREKQVVTKVIHTHGRHPIYHHQDCILIKSCRRDLFAAICSALIAETVAEYSVYTDAIYHPFAVGCSEFSQKYQYYTTFFDTIDQSQFASVTEVYYEDLIRTPTILVNDIDVPIDLTILHKSPRTPASMILNYSELLDLFNKLLKETPHARNSQ